MDALIAEKVMGWYRVGAMWCKGANSFAAQAEANNELPGVKVWSPSTDLAAAIEAFAHMKDYRGLRWSIEWIHPWSEYPQGGWWVKAVDWCGSLDPQDAHTRVDVVHDDLAYAIAQAVLQAVAL